MIVSFKRKNPDINRIQKRREVMMSHKNLLKSAVAGTHDYHALMQSVVFTIIPQTFQHAQVATDFGEFKIVKVEKELVYAGSHQNVLIEVTHVYLNCCWNCKSRYTHALYELIEPYRFRIHVRFYAALREDRYPELSPMIPIIVSWQCPFCGKIEAYDDIPF